MIRGKQKTALPVGAGKAAIGTGMICNAHSRSYNIIEQGV